MEFKLMISDCKALKAELSNLQSKIYNLKFLERKGFLSNVE
jgi:hypothetical protein